MNAFTKMLVDDLDRQLSAMKPEPVDHEEQVERMAELHRQGAAKYEKRIAATRKGLKDTLASLEEDRKFEKRRHDQAMAVFAERIADTKAQAERDIAADRKLVAASRAALASLSAE